ncbi:MAG: peptidoglycan-binding protein [Lachnospiraceae bacterium]|nr:peptidoglycan-binding protein [Lachnospiraceae bacterium]
MILSVVMAVCPMGTTGIGSVITAEAHSGRTDSSGGHHDNKNKSGLGSYHYHCGGYPAHLHSNGVCPYSSQTADTSSVQTPSGTPASAAVSSAEPAATSPAAPAASASQQTASDEAELIKKVQQALNEKGYDCGEADGIMGQKSTQALMNFQTDCGLTVDGVIGQEVKTALGIL